MPGCPLPRAPGRGHGRARRGSVPRLCVRGGTSWATFNVQPDLIDSKAAGAEPRVPVHPTCTGLHGGCARSRALASGDGVGVAANEVRAPLRRTACFSLALLVGVVGGPVTAGAAGGRRTDTAYRRFLAAHLAADLVVYSNPEFGEIDPEAVARLPGVAAASRVSFLGVTEPDINLVVPSGSGPDLSVDRPEPLRGRMPSPSRPDEAAIPSPWPAAAG